MWQRCQLHGGEGYDGDGSGDGVTLRNGELWGRIRLYFCAWPQCEKECCHHRHLQDTSSLAAGMVVEEVLREPQHLRQPVHDAHLQLCAGWTGSLKNGNDPGYRDAPTSPI